MNACTGASCRQGRAECTSNCRDAAPPFAWLARELRAAANLPRWFRTFRKSGFSRRCAAVLAWRTTRPINLTSTRNP